MIINHAKALGIGAAVMLSTAFGPVQGQTIPSNVARPLNAAANALTGGQVGYATPYAYTANGVPYQPAAPTYSTPTQPGYAPVQPGYAPVQQVQPVYPGYAPVQQTYPGYAPAQAGYPTGYYQSGYNGYVQPQATQQVYRQATPKNRVMNAVRSVVQPQRYASPTYAAPGYAPTYVVPR